MISLNRDRSNVIDQEFRGTDLVDNSLELVTDQRSIKQGNLEEHDFDSARWKKAKPQLLIETSDKCSYCEAPTAVVSYGDVEHYRPKSKYYWLAYCVDNYLASCAICNQKFKKAKFTHQNPKMRAPIVRSNSTDTHLDNLSQDLAPDPLDAAQVTAFETIHNNERPFPLNPYVEDPEQFFGWRADVNAEEVELRSLPGVPLSAEYVDAAEDIYGLNRQQLLTERYKTFRRYRVFQDVLLDPGLSAATAALVQAEIADMAATSSAFSGMIRFFEAAGQPANWIAAGHLIE